MPIHFLKNLRFYAEHALEHVDLWEYYFSLLVGLYDAERENNSYEGSQPGPGGQPGPGLSTPYLHNKHQVPDLAEGLSPRLVLDSTSLLLGLDLLPGSLPAASLLRSVPLVPVLTSLCN